MIRSSDAAFVGVACTASRLPLVYEPYHVPFLLNFPGAGESVYGELYAISPAASPVWTNSRSPTVATMSAFPSPSSSPATDPKERRRRRRMATMWWRWRRKVEAPYAHRSYVAELWRRKGERRLEAYSEKEARGYVKRKNRPQDTTFLDQIRTGSFRAFFGFPSFVQSRLEPSFNSEHAE